MAVMTLTAPQVGPAIVDVTKPDPEDLQLWSVTTIIGALDKPALIYWSAEKSSTCAVDNLDVVQAMAAKDRAGAIEWLSGARFRAADELSATSLGTVCHACCEDYAITGVRPDDSQIRQVIRSENDRLAADAIATETGVVNQMLDQFDAWLQQFSPSYQAVEVTVFSPTYGIAGTCDGFLTVDGVRCIFDYKTSRKSFDKRGKPTGPYPEVALQLSAYRYAELAAVWQPRRFEKFRRRSYLLSADEQALAVPVPEVDTGLVIHITPEHCTAYPVRCDEGIYDYFLHTLECARWSFQDSQTVIGAPLSPAVA